MASAPPPFGNLVQDTVPGTCSGLVIARARVYVRRDITVSPRRALSLCLSFRRHRSEPWTGPRWPERVLSPRTDRVCTALGSGAPIVPTDYCNPARSPSRNARARRQSRPPAGVQHDSPNRFQTVLARAKVTPAAGSFEFYPMQNSVNFHCYATPRSRCVPTDVWLASRSRRPVFLDQNHDGGQRRKCLAVRHLKRSDMHVRSQLRRRACVVRLSSRLGRPRPSSVAEDDASSRDLSVNGQDIEVRSSTSGM